MTGRHLGRIVIVAGSTAVLSACGGGGGERGASNADAGNTATSIVRPVATPIPAVTPSPRSIMQPAVQPTPTPTPPAPLDETIHFAKGGATLDDAAKATLDQVLEAPVMANGGAITLRGASDSKGDDAVNLSVSRKRATAVAAYLEGKGVAKDRITVVALGEGRPVAPDINLDGTDNPAGREANRRVDVHVEPAPPPPEPSDEATPAEVGDNTTPAPAKADKP